MSSVPEIRGWPGLLTAGPLMSAAAVGGYEFDLPAFCRWLGGEGVGLLGGTTEVLEVFRVCRQAALPG